MNAKNKTSCCSLPKKQIINNVFPNTSSDDFVLASTMRAEYKIPEIQKEVKLIGIRRAQMQRAWLEQMRVELEREQSQPAEDAERCTEYDGNFNGGGFVYEQPDTETLAAASDKFPLYASEPMSYYRYKLLGAQGDGRLCGISPIKDIRNPFKRCSQFTKPIGEQTEEVED